MEDLSVQAAWAALQKSFQTRKKAMSICLVAFLFLGLLAALTTQDEYQGDVVVLPELGGGSSASISSNLAGLSSLLGVSSTITQGGGGFGPDMYQEIIESQPFLSELVSAKFANSKSTKDSITLMDYFKEGEKRNVVSKTAAFIKELPSTIEGWFSSPSSVATKDPDFIKKEITPALLRANEVPPIVQMNGQKMQAMNIIKNRVKLDTKGREITISVKMPDPVLSAQVCKLVLEKLIEYVGTYKTAKQRDNLHFLELRKEEAEAKYKQAQMNVAGFKDNSLGLIFQSVQTREQVLQNEMNLAFTVYNQLATQLEQAKIDLKKESPIFSALNPIEIPNQKAEPIIWKIMFKYFSIGLMLCLLVLVIDLSGAFKIKNATK